MTKKYKIQKSRKAKSAITRKKAIKAGYRSAFEQNLAESMTCPYEYETEVIKWTYSCNRRYTPDFILTKKDGTKMYIEAKGRFFSKDRTKMKYVKEQNPDLDIRFVFLDGKTKLSKTSKTSYMDWAKRHGFPAYDCKRTKEPSIPEEWLNEC